MKNIKKIAALLLAACLLLTGVPYTASAAAAFGYDFTTLRPAVASSDYVDPSGDSDWYFTEIDDTLATLYAGGKIDIDLEDTSYGFGGKVTCSTPANFADGVTGAYTYTAAGTYIAFRMRKSASDTGTYTMKFHHDVSARGGVVSMHILPVGTTDIKNALGSDNRVGVVDFNGGNGNTDPSATENAHRTDTVGYWDFGNEEEFILVFNLIENSPYFSTQCYMFLSYLTFTPGDSEELTVSERINPLMVSGNAVEYFETVVYAAVGKVTEDGRERYNLYLPIEGDRLNVYDLEKMEKIDEVVIPFDVCRGITVDDDGMVWMVGSAPCVFKYDPNTGATTEYGSYKSHTNGKANSGFYLYDEGGYLYFGTSENAYVIRFNKSTGAYTAYNYGSLTTGGDAGAYACGVSVKDGILYCGFAGNKNKDGIETYEILKIRLSDSTLLGSADFTNMFQKSEVMFRGLGVTSDGILFASASGCYGMVCVDTESMTTFNPTDKSGKPVYNKINYDVTEIDGVTYLCLGSTGMDSLTGTKYAAGDSALMTAGLYKWVEDASYAHGGYLEYVGDFNKALNCGQSSYAVIEGKRCIVAKGYNKEKDKNYITYYDLDTGRSYMNYDLIREEDDGAPITLQPLSADRDGNLYMGTFNTSKCSIFNTGSETFTGSFFTSGQTDALLWYAYNGEYNLYAGNYNTGRLTKVNMDGENEYLLGFKAFDNYETELTPEEQIRLYDLHQSRVHTIAAGGSKIYIGSIPDQYEFGGALGWYDLETGETFATRGADLDGNGQGDGVIYHQSIIKLVYMEHNGAPYLAGITSIDGGTGADVQTASDTLNAKLFIYDVTNNSVVLETNLKSELAAMGYTLANQSTLTALEADPDGNGLWCIAGDCLFNFTYNGEGIDINAMAEFSSLQPKRDGVPVPYSHSGHRARDIVFDDTYIYAPFCDYAGVQQIHRTKLLSGTLQSNRLPVMVSTFYAIGGDGNLYYTKYEKLYMYPLTATDSDISAAKAVDQQIFDLGVITADSIAAVSAAQSAYDNLQNEQKAIAKNLYLLEEAHIDLLKARIDAIGTNYLENAQTIEELMAQYKALPAHKKAMITNYSALKAAYDAVDAFYQVGETAFKTLEEAIAAAVQTEDKTVKLIKDVQETELILTNGVILDLCGHVLDVSAIAADGLEGADGHIVDSSDDNNGLLRTERDSAIVREDNSDLPLYDAKVGGYRFFDYKLELHSSTSNAGTGKEKFWFKFHFYTDDTCTAMDQDAYELICADGSNLEISTDISWRGNFLRKVSFGMQDESNELSTELFSEKWADNATLSRWLYVTVSGLDKVGYGTLEVTPVITVNGVEISEGTITYEKKMEDPEYGWTEGGPNI